MNPQTFSQEPWRQEHSNGVALPRSVQGLPARVGIWYKVGPFPPCGMCMENPVMPKVCQVTGKRPMRGNNVSHANNKTKRRFLPNLHYRRLWVESEKRWVSLRLSTKGLRTLDKNGIDSVLADIRARGDKI